VTRTAFGPSLSLVFGAYLRWVYLRASDIPLPSFSAVTAHIPYIVPILNILTGKNWAVPPVRAFGRERVFKRLEAGASRKDLFYHLVRQCTESANVHLTKADYRVVRNSLKQSAPLSTKLHWMAGWPSLLVRTQQAAPSRPSSITSCSIQRQAPSRRNRLGLHGWRRTFGCSEIEPYGVAQ